MKIPEDAFDFDPDYRRDPKDFNEPYCCHCQRNLDPSTAIPVTINDETHIAVPGHDRIEEIRTNFKHDNMTLNAWIGKDCLRRLAGKARRLREVEREKESLES